MSDAAPPVQLADSFVDGSNGGALSPDAIDRVLGEFRTWLTELNSLPAPTEEPPAIDLHTLVAQFTALRHEINLQTKATRSTLEQNGEVLSELRSTVEQLQEQPTDDGLDPLLKSLVDVYDNLSLALGPVERQRNSLEGPLTDFTADPLPDSARLMLPAAPRLRFWSFLFAQSDAAARQGGVWDAMETVRKEITARQNRATDAAKQIRSSLDSLIAGYRMSLARIERILEQSGLEVIATQDETFDPELMEVVEVVGETGRPAGEVVEEVRRGYLRGEVVFRYAQVKVAR